MPLRVVLRWSEQGQAGHTAWGLVVEHSRFILAVITVCCPWFTYFPRHLLPSCPTFLQKHLFGTC